jgi:hypothetical protein
LDRDKKAAQKAGRSIKRTPWKVDVRDRLDRVREDIEMTVRASGWKITGAPDWPSADDESGENDGSSGPIALEALDGTVATAQMREAEAVVLATFVYIAKTEATLRQSTQIWQRPWEWLSGGLLMSAYTSLHAAETNRVLLLSSDQLAALLPTIRQRAVRYLPANDPRLEALQGLPDPTAPTHQALARVQSKLLQTVAAAQATAPAQREATSPRPAASRRWGKAPARRSRPGRMPGQARRSAGPGSSGGGSGG